MPKKEEGFEGTHEYLLCSKSWEGLLTIKEGSTDSSISRFLELVLRLVQEWRVMQPVQLMYVIDDAIDALDPLWSASLLQTRHFSVTSHHPSRRGLRLN